MSPLLWARAAPGTPVVTHTRSQPAGHSYNLVAVLTPAGQLLPASSPEFGRMGLVTVTPSMMLAYVWGAEHPLKPSQSAKGEGVDRDTEVEEEGGM